MRKTKTRERAIRSNPTQRKKEILGMAIYLSERIGHLNITRDLVAGHCKITGSLVARYFSTMIGLKRAVFKEAVRLEILPILSHCVMHSGCKLSPELKSKVLNYLAQK